MSDYQVSVALGGGVTGFSGVFNVLDYGAVGDGVADDTAAIQAAIDACVSAGHGTVKIPPLNYLVSSAIDVVNDNSNLGIEIDAVGAYIFAASGHADDILTIGSAATRSRHVRVRGGKWGISSRDWTGTCGIRLLNCVNCTLESPVIYNCEKGIAVRGESAKGSVFNMVMNPQMIDCGFGYHLSADASDGWCNANNFYGGQITWSSAYDAVDMSSYFAIAIAPDASWDNDPNANLFFGVACECSSGQAAASRPGLAYITGQYNQFLNVRDENFNNAGSNAGRYTFDTNAVHNYIWPAPSSGVDVSAMIEDADRLKANVLASREKMFQGGSATYPILELNARSSGYRALDIYEALGANPTFYVLGGGSFGTAPQTEPSSPTEGQIYYDSAANKLKVYTGSAWETITSA